jgi:hypothetical protein
MAAATMGARWLQATNNEDKELDHAGVVVVVVFWCKCIVTFFTLYLPFIISTSSAIRCDFCYL